jgi:hypothetical protein
VEDLGFDHLLAYDHVLGADHVDRTPPITGPYTEHDRFHDPFVMFAYLAAITERIAFVTAPRRRRARQEIDMACRPGPHRLDPENARGRT